MFRVIIIIISLLLTACTTTPDDKINIKNFYVKEPIETLLSLVAVDRTLYEKQPFKAGSHIFYIERLKSGSDGHAIHSVHIVKGKLEKNNAYQIRSKTDQGTIYVWLENSHTNKIISSISSLSNYNLPVIKLPKDIETIAISDSPISRSELNGTNHCSFKKMVSNMNQGFSDSITDKKLPTRFNQPKC